MNERISALIDGHFDTDGHGEDMLGTVARSESSRALWSRYALIGDAIRGEPSLEVDLTAAVMAKLDEEPTVLAPVAVVRERQRTQGMWQRLLPVAASVMGVAAVGWVALKMNTQEAEPVVAAINTTPAAVKTVVAEVTPEERARVNRDTALRAFVLAHQGTVGGALPGVAPYVRTVAETPQAPRQ